MIDRYNCEYCSIIGENDMCEAKDGEWVRYEDIKHLLQNTPSNSDYAVTPTSRKGEKMKCENCHGIGIVNLYEKTGENISTDCHLCNGTGQISHQVEEQSQFNDWYREVEDEDEDV